MNFKTDSLLNRDAYYYNEGEKLQGGEFYEAVMEELIFHYDNNEKYKRFCINKGFDPHGFSGLIEDIPPVQVAVFKELGKTLTSVQEENIKLTLQSSATSGVPSSILVDKITAKRQAKAMVKVIGDVIGNTRKPILVMDVDPAEGFREILGARYAAVTGYLNFASQTEYFLKINENKQYYFDITGIQKYISSLDKNESVIIFGFTYILFSEVLKPLGEQEIIFNLPSNSKIIHIGGWKKLESEKITKAEFNERAAKLFGIDALDVIDIYGFTEQMGINYPDCKCGWKHTPLYSDIIIRDIVTKESLPAGQEGLMEFISPIPHSYPGVVVLTDDLGIMADGECPYGRAGKRFKMTGRLKKAEVRGCGDILSSKLKFAGDSIHENALNDEKYSVIYYPNKKILETLDSKESLIELERKLRAKQEWLHRQSIDSLIGLIAQVAPKWNANMDNNPKFTELKMNGLNFLSNWCTIEHLTEVMTQGLNGNRKYIDTFLPVAENNVQYRKATSRGLVCHWLAGNVQVLGMFVLIESILCKNVNLMKLSSRDDGVFAALLQAFEDEIYITKGGNTVKGNDLLETIALVYYDHNARVLGEQMSMAADVRIAWGGERISNDRIRISK